MKPFTNDILNQDWESKIMSKRFIASFTLAAFTFLAVPVAALPAGATSVVSSTGRVMTKLDGKWTEGASQLGKGAQIKTAADSSATISLPDGSMVRLAPNSEIAIADITDKGVVVDLSNGQVLGQPGQGLQVRTGNSVTNATTGEFIVNASGESTQMEVLSGNASVTSLDNSEVVYSNQVVEGKTVAQEAGDETDLEEGTVVKGKNGTWLVVAGGILVVAIIVIIASSDGEGDPPFPSPSNP